MTQYIFNIWNDEETKEVLIIAESENEAIAKLESTDIDFSYEDYEIIDEEYYDFVIS